jgi:tetratricopeptide (TPR) repeat protein
LSTNNSDSSTSILSFKEIIGIVVVFSFVLYLLFPKENIDQIIEGKSKNRNLSINYLESMLLYYPDSFRIKRILIENYEYIGKFEKALKLNRQLLKITKDRERLKQLYLSEYSLLKKLYFRTDDEALLKKLKEKLYSYFEFTKGERDYTFFFAESMQIDFQKLKYVSLQGFLRERPELVNYDFEKDAFTQALALGHEEEAYGYLLHLLEYAEFEESLQEYALSLLLKHKNYTEAITLVKEMFLRQKSQEKRIKYFNIALYLTIKNSNNSKEKIVELIEFYKDGVDLKAFDIALLLQSLLQAGDVHGASTFSQEAFLSYRDEFDENVTTIAVQSLTYDKQLSSALEIALFAKDKFKTIEWLDKSIQLSLWLGKMDDVVTLNIEGYRRYKSLKYEHFLLNSSTLNNAYGILGEIYKNSVNAGDYTSIKKLADYYEYTGEIVEAERFFTNLLKKAKNREVYRETILACYRNSHYKKGLNLYKIFQKYYGIDKKLHGLAIEKFIALKKYKEAYRYAKQLKEDKRLLQLGWLQKDYNYIYKSLWRAEDEKRLVFANYDKLIKLESAFNKGKRLPYLYNKLWKKTKKRVYLTALLYQYLEREDLKSIKKLLSTLSQKDRAFFNKNIQYHIVLANYFIKSKELKSAMSEYKKALELNPKAFSTHQAYLWFLLDNELIKPLKKELALLRKDKKLQKKVGFPCVITAFKLQQSDLALKWLKPLLKVSDNIEYQVVYADLLDLQDRVSGATKVRLKLFKRLDKMVKQNPKLLSDKEFARVYLGLALRYKNPYSQRAVYLKKFKSLFSKREFLEMEIGWYTYSQSSMKVRSLATKNSINIPWLNLYLSFSLGDTQAKQKILHDSIDTLPFRDRVMASLDIGDRAGAYTLAFKGMNDNRRDVELFKIYNSMINGAYPKSSFSSKYRHLTPTLSAIESRVGYSFTLYKGIESKFLFSHYSYKEKNRKKLSDSSFGLSLKNSHKKFLWDISLSKHNSEESFISAMIDLKYRFDSLELGIKSTYQNKTTQTPYLQTDGMENSTELTLKKVLSQPIQLSLNYKKNSYTLQNKRKIGDSEHFQISGDYLLRTGYPDIKFNGYVNYNSYDNRVENLLPKNFTEIGSQVSIGTSSKNTIHNSFKPFASLGLAVNNRYDIGTSLSFGLSGALNGGDIVTATVDYSKGIDAISEPYYGFHLGYEF